MMEKKKLNADYAEAVSSLQSALRRFVPKRLYKRIFRGKGLEFDKYREYQPEDDASLIDWKASLRGNKLLARQYIEERDLKILFVVDVGENMVFGSTEKLKCEYSAEIAAALSHLIYSYDDNIGFILFSDKIKEVRWPKKGEDQYFLLIDSLSNPYNYGGISNLQNILDYLIMYVDKKDVDCVFLISDFIYADNKVKDKMNLVAEKFETVGLMVRDPLDFSLPKFNKEVLIENPITNSQLIVNPKKVGGHYEKYAKEQLKMVEDLFSETKADFYELRTDKDFASDIAAFLRGREKGSREIMPGG